MMAIDVFETTVQKTYEWLNDLMNLLEWTDEHKAYLALRGTLQALRDRLTVELSAKLSAQLPMLIRGFYYEGWKPAATPIKLRTPKEFLEFVALHFHNTPLAQEANLEEIVRAVFRLIANHVSAGEVDRLKQALPPAIADLWPSIERQAIK